MIIRQIYRRQSRVLFSAVRPTFQPSRYLLTQTETPQPTVQIEKSPTEDEVETLENKLQAAEQFENAMTRRNQFNKFGSKILGKYLPDDLLNNPPRPSEITLEILLASQTHLGHATALWNPRNSSYIFGIREGIHIISLEVTAAYLRRAAKIVEEVSRRGGLVLFVGTRENQSRAVVRAAELAKGYHVFTRWVPGSITNGEQLLKGCALKVVDEFDNQLPQYDENLKNKPVLRPDLVVCLNPMENVVLLRECRAYNIPTIGVIDTDADVTRVTYPIPANDDSIRSITLIAGVLGRAGEAGQKRRFEETKAGKLPYTRISEDEIMKDPFSI
ncbi:hypothetical protein LOZ12_002079 [Ophidiomyces ophidiicola]|uniref:Uncharacterized protein n=1 Tax=Ophidiomyces ophidiicola TaxID=1387563 RepID=A0ACB8UY16_9EURO|nr:hypothetical protein LOZ64_003221 [Ophidiomyces ophidiicola]KAI1947982.1 hypothetical protein LOZ62_002840 [Ophidiomyces ophidiicola]KAI1961600.1 hypothetical protein LOZ59_002402 [Ophidiomyces ophidiicola]KAI1974188.1 hypothetical protein LOZ56_001389 [Ophidiomyces ophidiicola]KAI2006974.1 hypothetical protein LOZ50_002830 [Ophidiomyces ophidiicola]